MVFRRIIINQNTQDEVYNFIISDLLSASQALPDKYGASDLGRATKGAALGLLSKVYLYKKTGRKLMILLTR